MFTTVLYDVIVSPLVYVVDFIFSLTYRMLGNPGMAIIAVSFLVNCLCLPLYRMADRIQGEERDRQASMAHWVEHIKHNYKGDEQYMMLSAYYRQKGYKPIYALNSSLSVLLQIPVFIAAYRYLSDLEVLQGASFLFLKDLSLPDALIQINGLSINVMPVVMTALNVVSTYIYTSDLALRDKIQAYGLAGLFLVLLYQSPSGLVMYWTCNQIFSLVKNVFLKILKNPGKVSAILTQALIVWFLGFLFGLGNPVSFGVVLLLGLLFVLFDYPVLSKLTGWKAPFPALQAGEGLKSTPIFFAASILLATLLGVLIPSALLGSSPQEFAHASGFSDPIVFVVHAACVMGGLFVLWVGTFYFLSKQEGRNAIAFGVTCLALVNLADYFFFDQTLGVISTSLTYETAPTFDFAAIAVNLVAVVGIVALVGAAWKMAPRVVAPVLVIMTIGIVFLAVPNVNAVINLKPATSSKSQVQDDSGISATQASATSATTAGKEIPFTDDGTPQPILNFSKNGTNVMVIFLDRAVSGYLPYLMNERPDLAQKLDGFTYYPNTISFGPKTVFGSPALYGGYEYTTRAMNARNNVELVNKHDEALLVMPTIFSQAGYDVTVLDPPLVNYQFSSSDYTLYNGLANTSVYHTEGAYNEWYTRKVLESGSGDIVNYETLMARAAASLRRNLCYYSVFRTSPTCLKTDIYDQGGYLSVTSSKKLVDKKGRTTTAADDATQATDPTLAQEGATADATAAQPSVQTAPADNAAANGEAAVQESPAEETMAEPLESAGEEGSGEENQGEASAEGETVEDGLAAEGVPTEEGEQTEEGSSEEGSAEEQSEPVEGEPETTDEGEPVEEGSTEEGELTEEGEPTEESGPTEEELAAQRAAEAAAHEQLMQSLVNVGYQGEHEISTAFLGWYSVLASLTDVTHVADDASSHFMLIQNSTTHEPDWLQLPDYTPAMKIDNTAYTNPAVYTLGDKTLNFTSEAQMQHYMIDMAALLRLGEWFDYLREQGVYDNTRIIIVGDHGHTLGQFPELRVNERFNAEMVNPLFMVKDFNAHGFATSYDFMTNADTPVYAMAGLVQNPTNPFTGVPITSDEKTAHPQEITTSQQWQAGTVQTGTTFDTSSGEWYSVHDNIFDLNNWSLVE